MSVATNHVTTIDRDSVGHWGWRCTGCPEEASGFERAAEVIESAEAHGPRAANSMVPSDDEDEGPGSCIWNYDNQRRSTVILTKGLSAERMTVLVASLTGPDAKWRLIRDESGRRVGEREEG